ncbi:MAG: ATP-binding cassette domain-containing protein, partial [Alphaproteobacteria bacterium]|nr:ATP-binding cassette domain-containing protein [Alphaproteobacteria bacterium]
MTSNRTPLLRVRDLTHRYGRHLGCAEVNFDLYPGEVLGIVGESGSGKTTLLQCISGQMQASEGMVEYLTRDQGPVDIYAMSEARRRLLMRTDWGIVYQNARDGLRMKVSAGANVGERLMAIGDRHYGHIRDEAVDWLQRVEMDIGRIDDMPATFSGGMQQRLQIASNLVTKPRLVFMDEPTSGL